VSYSATKKALLQEQIAAASANSNNANNGTILLDEIGDMPLPLQAKILRLLQEQSFERVGGSETVRTDVRLIAATHRDLKAMSAEEKFRFRFYYRLSVFTIHLPPLRERGEDLPMLVQHFVRRFSAELGRRFGKSLPRRWPASELIPGPVICESCKAVLKQAFASSTWFGAACLFPA